MRSYTDRLYGLGCIIIHAHVDIIDTSIQIHIFINTLHTYHAYKLRKTKVYKLNKPTFKHGLYFLIKEQHNIIFYI